MQITARLAKLLLLVIAVMGWLGLALLLRSLWAASVVSRNDTALGALLVDAVL